MPWCKLPKQIPFPFLPKSPFAGAWKFYPTSGFKNASGVAAASQSDADGSIVFPKARNGNAMKKEKGYLSLECDEESRGRL